MISDLRVTQVGDTVEVSVPPGAAESLASVPAQATALGLHAMLAPDADAQYVAVDGPPTATTAVASPRRVGFGTLLLIASAEPVARIVEDGAALAVPPATFAAILGALRGGAPVTERVGHWTVDVRTRGDA